MPWFVPDMERQTKAEMENQKYSGLIPIDEVVKSHGVCRRTLQRKSREGLLTRYSVVGSRKVYLDALEVEAVFRPKPKQVPA